MIRMPVKTAVFKIYNPSKHKQTVMNFALKQYTLAYDYLINLAKANFEIIIEIGLYNNKYSTQSIIKVLTPLVGSKLRHFKMHGSMRESLLQDVAASLLQYIELKKEDENTSFPTARLIKYKDEYYLEALEELSQSITLEEENRARDALTESRRSSFMPIYFGRPDGVIRNRNFGLMYNPSNNKFFAVLYLLPSQSSRKKAIKPKDSLVPIHTISTIWKATGREVGYIIVPLAYEKWHEEVFLKRAIENPSSVRSAFLSYKNGEYFLHVAFEFEADKIEHDTLLGIDRGIINLAALTVIDYKGNIIYQEEYSGNELERIQDSLMLKRQLYQQVGKNLYGNKKEKRITDQHIHILANHIVEVATRYKSQVIMEDLKRLNYKGYKGKLSTKKALKTMNRRLSRVPYNKLLNILNYKLPLAGLNKPKLVKARYTSQECPICGEISRDNRRGLNFKCLKCGYEANADLNGSHNIARRGINVLKKAEEKRKEIS